MSLVSTFGAITKNFKLKPQQYIIDNLAFRLHYKATVLFFLVGTILVTSRQYIGEHIRCIADGGVPEHVMNTFCFFTTTFTVIKNLDAKLLDSGNLAHPGVGPYDFEEPIKRHAYYQWVPFVLFGQGLMFYLTHLFWKKLEGGRLRRLVDGLRYAAFALNENEMNVKDKKIPSKAEKDLKIQEIRQIFLQGIYINKSWSRNLIFCEIVNLLHVVLQIYITNKFLNGNFKGLGYEVWTQGLDSSVDVLDEVFPKMRTTEIHEQQKSSSIIDLTAIFIQVVEILVPSQTVYKFFAETIEELFHHPISTLVYKFFAAETIEELYPISTLVAIKGEKKGLTAIIIRTFFAIQITKCTFHKYGPSGSIQLHDAMCVMALNIINDKIYTALWFWFIFLFVTSCAALLWRAATIALHARSSTFNKMVFASSCPGRLNPWDRLMVSRHGNYSDWLFLVYLAKNLDPMVFREIFSGIAEDLEEKKALKEPLIGSDGLVNLS